MQIAAEVSHQGCTAPRPARVRPRTCPAAVPRPQAPHPRRPTCDCRAQSSSDGECSTSAWQPALCSLAAGVTALSLAFSPPAWADDTSVSSDVPVYDGARLIATEKRQQVSEELRDFESRTGWRVRVFTSYGTDSRPTDDALRAAWRPDKNTVVVNFDSSNPSLTNFVYLGDSVLSKLRRPFWFELQARYGSIFYVRDEGEQTAILNTIGAMTQCLEVPEGCRVVPGLTADQWGVCFAMSVAGGIIAGSTWRLEPTGFVTNRWLWPLLFSPLWGSLFFSFGLGPVVTRTDDWVPILANTAGFLVAAATPNLLASLREPPPDSTQGGGNSSTPQ